MVETSPDDAGESLITLDAVSCRSRRTRDARGESSFASVSPAKRTCTSANRKEMKEAHGTQVNTHSLSTSSFQTYLLKSWQEIFLHAKDSKKKIKSIKENSNAINCK